MNLRHLAALAVLTLSTGAAFSQTQTEAAAPIQNRFGIYLTPIATRISNSTADTGVFAFLGEGTTSRFFEGFGFGAYDEFLHGSRVDAGVDVRATLVRGAGAQLTNFLVGGRIVYKPVDSRLRPYVEFSGGVGGSKPAHNPLSTSRAEYTGAVGLDYRLGKHVDLRAVEVGYGSVQTVSSYTANSGVSRPASQLLNLSTGIVFRIP